MVKERGSWLCMQCRRWEYLGDVCTKCGQERDMGTAGIADGQATPPGEPLPGGVCPVCKGSGNLASDGSLAQGKCQMCRGNGILPECEKCKARVGWDSLLNLGKDGCVQCVGSKSPPARPADGMAQTPSAQCKRCNGEGSYDTGGDGTDGGWDVCEACKGSGKSDSKLEAAVQKAIEPSTPAVARPPEASPLDALLAGAAQAAEALEQKAMLLLLSGGQGAGKSTLAGGLTASFGLLGGGTMVWRLSLADGVRAQAVRLVKGLVAAGNFSRNVPSPAQLIQWLRSKAPEDKRQAIGVNWAVALPGLSPHWKGVTASSTVRDLLILLGEGERKSNPLHWCQTLQGKAEDRVWHLLIIDDLRMAVELVYLQRMAAQMGIGVLHLHLAGGTPDFDGLALAQFADSTLPEHDPAAKDLPMLERMFLSGKMVWALRDLTVACKALSE